MKAYGHDATPPTYTDTLIDEEIRERAKLGRSHRYKSPHQLLASDKLKNLEDALAHQ